MKLDGRAPIDIGWDGKFHVGPDKCCYETRWEVFYVGVLGMCGCGSPEDALDHIDGNSDNNTLENVRLVCPNCHTQTHTWCGRQKKINKRNIYLQKYKGDKSKSETPLLHSGEEGAVPSLPTIFNDVGVGTREPLIKALAADYRS